MDQVELARTFLIVVESGSFSIAARQLNVAPSVVTKRVSQLEAAVGRLLFERTTRRIVLTSSGRAVIMRAKEFLLAYDRMRADLDGDIQELAGRLRIKAPSTLTYLYLARIINQFMIRYPKVTIELLLIDRPVNPITEGFDLVITGLPPSYEQIEEVALFSIRRKLFSSPEYLRRMGVPIHTEDLAHHQCLQYSYLSTGDRWVLTGMHGQVDVEVNSTFYTNDIRVMHQALVDGLGIGILPDYVAQEAVDAGQLVPVLENFQLPEFWFRAQYAKSHRHRRLLTYFINYIANELDRAVTRLTK